MKTVLLPGDHPNTVETAAQILKSGGLVALPTETVYGLGADGLNPEAVVNIFQAKGRPQDNPLILHIGKAEDLADFCENIPQSAWDLAKAFWPGPLTMVLEARDIVPKVTRAGLDTVGVRCPDHDLTRAIILATGKPIAAPSANRSGKPSTTTADHVFADMDGRIDGIVDGGSCSVGVESTIVDLTGEVPRLLRPGGITPAQLVEILGELDVDRAVLGQIDQDEVVRAPGMKYKHYAPDATVLIVDGDGESAADYVAEHFEPADAVLCFAEELEIFSGFNPIAYGSLEQPESLARGLFSALRDLDGKGISTVYARCPQGEGVAYAVANRLKKAAAFTVVNLPKRKRNRAEAYDYSLNGAYFITICTNKRKKLFWEVGADSIRPQSAAQLSHMGKVVETAIQNIPNHYDGVTVEKYVIMPDHIHLMVMIGSNEGRMISAPTISTIVGQMKRWISKEIGMPIWQKSYYDHVVRNKEDFLSTWQYIENNPKKYWLQKDDRITGG